MSVDGIDEITRYWREKDRDGKITFSSGEEASALIGEALKQIGWLIQQVRWWRAKAIGDGLVAATLEPEALLETAERIDGVLQDLTDVPDEALTKLLDALDGIAQSVALQYRAAGCPYGPDEDARNVMLWWRDQFNATVAAIKATVSTSN